MRFSRTPSFDRTFRKLQAPTRASAEQAIASLVRAMATGERSEGLGLKKLRKDLWEIRVGLSMRVLFVLKGDLVTFVLVGTHEDIRRYLKGL